MATYRRQRYLFMAVDPVHIGTGGYRLGRVDNSIVREPGTRIPKIPGTSLHGAVRSYAARLYENPDAVGKDGAKNSNPLENPIYYTFGHIKTAGGQSEAFSGVINIFDAHVLFFPVYSMAGPIWVSTPGRLREAGFTVRNVSPEGDGQKYWTPPEAWEARKVFLSWERSEPINLGWLMVEKAGQVDVAAPDDWESEDRWKNVAGHLVLLQESLFSHVINSNLEVRTSVAIDHERGAARDGALFTYEALPRATFLTAEVVLDDYREQWPLRDEERQKKSLKGNFLPGESWVSPLAVVKAGLRLIECLGVGGMGTRGFGRLAMVGEPLELY